jgi:hypothetical protein
MNRRGRRSIPDYAHPSEAPVPPLVTFDQLEAAEAPYIEFPKHETPRGESLLKERLSELEGELYRHPRDDFRLLVAALMATRCGAEVIREIPYSVFATLLKVGPTAVYKWMAKDFPGIRPIKSRRKQKEG